MGWRTLQQAAQLSAALRQGRGVALRPRLATTPLRSEERDRETRARARAHTRGRAPACPSLPVLLPAPPRTLQVLPPEHVGGPVGARRKVSRRVDGCLPRGSSKATIPRPPPPAHTQARLFGADAYIVLLLQRKEGWGRLLIDPSASPFPKQRQGLGGGAVGSNQYPPPTRHPYPPQGFLASDGVRRAAAAAAAAASLARIAHVGRGGNAARGGDAFPLW